jgi:hypothetical protein
MYEITVTIVSAEEALDGTAEFWCQGELIAYTRYDDRGFVLHIEPCHDGAPRVVDFQAMSNALAEATRLLGVY